MTLPHDVAGAGSDVLLLHNGLCDRRMWGRQMRSFADSFRVNRCDLPGHGDMPVPERPFSYAEEVLALLLKQLGDFGAVPNLTDGGFGNRPGWPANFRFSEPVIASRASPALPC